MCTYCATRHNRASPPCAAARSVVHGGGKDVVLGKFVEGVVDRLFAPRLLASEGVDGFVYEFWGDEVGHGAPVATGVSDGVVRVIESSPIGPKALRNMAVR